MRAQFFVGCAVVSALVTSLSACSNTALAGLRTISQAWRDGEGVDLSLPLDPNVQYLRVQSDRQSGLMVGAGEVDSPRGAQTRWYSADGVVLRLAQGRVAAVHDGARSWTWIDGPPPVDWQRVAAGQAKRFKQVSDRQPGYRIGLVRERELRVALRTLPDDVLQASRHITATVTWFEERNILGEPELAWYAVDLSAQPPRVVFGQACLQADWCLNWQPWPPEQIHQRLHQTASAP